MLSFYYADNKVPSNIDDFATLQLLSTVDEQEKIISFFEKSRLTRRNVFSEYYPLDRECKEKLKDLFGSETFERYQDHAFVLVIYKVDKDNFESCKEKVECTILLENQFPLARKRSEFVDEKDIMRVHYCIKKKPGDSDTMDMYGNPIKK